MELNTRRDLFSFFLGFVARTKERQLREAIARYVKQGYKRPLPEDVFEFCPFNYDQKQIIRGCHIFENGRHADIVWHLQDLLGEYLYLVSDFLPPCCGDGRAFYCMAFNGEVCLECDRCNAVYTLDEEIIEISHRKKMLKEDFVMLTGEAKFCDWPYHTRMKILLEKR
jgi:hypothetical protein